MITEYTIAANEYDATNLTTCEVSFYRQLNIVNCIYHLATVSFSDSTVDHTIVTAGRIPSAFRPANDFLQDIGSYTGTVNHGLLRVNSDGSMKIRSGTNNTSIECYGRLTYIVED